jgi:hypothetical protein
MARILSSKTNQVGRPGGWQSARVAFGRASGKLSVRRLMRRDPAKGISTPAADALSFTENTYGEQNPTVLSGSQRKTQGPSTRGKTVVPNRSVDRSIKKR